MSISPAVNGNGWTAPDRVHDIHAAGQDAVVPEHLEPTNLESTNPEPTNPSAHLLSEGSQVSLTRPAATHVATKDSPQCSASMHSASSVEVSSADVSSQLANADGKQQNTCLLYTSPSPRDATLSRMPSSA